MIIEVSYRGRVGTKMIEKMEKLGTGLGIYYHRSGIGDSYNKPGAHIIKEPREMTSKNKPKN